MSENVDTNIHALYEIRNALVRFHARIGSLQTQFDRFFRHIDEQLSSQAPHKAKAVSDERDKDSLKRFRDTIQDYSAQQEKFSRLFQSFFAAEADMSTEKLATIRSCIDILEQYLGISFRPAPDDRSPPTANDNEYRMTPAAVNEQWKSMLRSIDIQIENYKEALINRGIPECKWLRDELATHRAAMMEQAGYNLDVASGHKDETVHNAHAYDYPNDQEYAAFYDGLAAKFRNYCLSKTNPNYDLAPEWNDNCQRCVPTYEALRRGLDATARPSTYGSTHLAYHPFDIWNGAQVIHCQENGRQEIESQMSSWGNGARAQVVVYWDGPHGGGHTFIAEQIDGCTVFTDPQTGNTDVSSYFSRVIPGTTQFCRIDELSFSPYHIECWEED